MVENYNIILKSQKELQTILDAIDESIFVIDTDNVILRCNKCFSNFFNLHPKDMIGRKIFCFFTDESESILQFIEKAKESEQELFEEVSIKQRNYFINSYPAKFLDKKSFIFVIKDVTDVFLMKEKLYNSYKLTSLGRVVGGIAHEINNPLTGVIGYADMLLMIGKDENIQEIVRKIKMATETCKRVTESLLFFARQVPLSKGIVNINDILETVLILRGYNLRKLNIEVEKNFSIMPYTLLDVQQIELAFLSLIMNAEEAIEEKGTKGKITISTECRDNSIYVTIKDNGIGIEQKNIKFIFEPFFTTKDIHKNMGLGMSIVNSIIEEHGGEIGVESVYGEGTKFIIRIPIAKE